MVKTNQTKTNISHLLKIGDWELISFVNSEINRSNFEPMFLCVIPITQSFYEYNLIKFMCHFFLHLKSESMYGFHLLIRFQKFILSKVNYKLSMVYILDKGWRLRQKIEAQTFIPHLTQFKTFVVTLCDFAISNWLKYKEIECLIFHIL